MKKLILSILFILSLSFQASAWNPMVVVSGTSESAGCVPEANIKFWWECETTTAEYSNDDSTATISGTAALTADADKSGTNGVDIAGGAGYYYFDHDTSGIGGSEGRIGTWFYVNSGMGTNVPTILALFHGGDGSYKPSFYFHIANSSGYVKLTWDNNTAADINITSAGACVSTGNWYWVEFWWDDTDDSIGYQLYDVNLDAVTNCNANTTGEFDTVQTHGDLRVGGNEDIYVDHVIVVNDHELSLLPCANESSFPY